MHFTISIITVTYNAENHLPKTIESVINQTYPYIEYIIIDGNSSDGTKGIIKKYEENISFWISQPDTGLYDAMNKGLNVANGDYVYFLNAGDELKDKDILFHLFEIAQQNNFPDILYGETDIIDAKGNLIGPRRLKTPENLTWKSFRMGMLVSHQAFIAKKNIVSGFDLHYQYSADFEWCIRCMKKADTIVNTHLVLVNYLYEGLTTSNRKKSLKERYNIMCKYYGTFVTLLLHSWFALRFYWAKFNKKTL